MTDKPKKPVKSRPFPIAKLVLDMLTVGKEEPYEFRHPTARKGIDAALKALFLSKTTDHAAALDELVRLAYVLEVEERSPLAAQVILDALHASEPACRILNPSAAKDMDMARFSRFNGGRPKALAARHDEKAPEGALKLADLAKPSGVRPQPLTKAPNKPATEKSAASTAGKKRRRGFQVTT